VNIHDQRFIDHFVLALERHGPEQVAKIVLEAAVRIGFRGAVEEAIFAQIHDDQQRHAPVRLVLVHDDDDPGAA
jgi:hypothetical protein